MTKQVFYQDKVRFLSGPMFPPSIFFPRQPQEFHDRVVLAGRPEEIHPKHLAAMIVKIQQLVLWIGSYIQYHFSGDRPRNQTHGGRVRVQEDESVFNRPLDPEFIRESVPFWSFEGGISRVVFDLADQPRQPDAVHTVERVRSSQIHNHTIAYG